jgi:hypothetical protein
METNMTKLNFVKLNTANIEDVQSERWTADKQDKEPRTLAEMRDKVVQHINASIEALSEPLFVKTPMVRKERIGFAVKIGYGSKNERLAQTERCKTAEAAINTLEEAIVQVENGDFDEILNAKLEGYRDRAEKGKLARQKNKKTLHAVA